MDNAIFVPRLCLLEQTIYHSKIKNIHYQRVYFGHEFCEKLMPGLKDIQQAFDFCRNQRYDFTLVTSYLTEHTISDLATVLEEVNQWGSEIEIVVNDWGTFNILSRFPNLRPVIGRLLNKMLRDPRLEFVKNDREVLAYYQKCSLVGTEFEQYLFDLGARVIEFDNLVHGMDLEFQKPGLKGALYLPYGVISTGRICLPGSWTLQKAQKFTTTACSASCSDVELEMEQTEQYDGIHKILQFGNTVFYRQDEKLLQKGITYANSAGFDRVVYQPIPF